MSNNKRLERDLRNNAIGGVCSGLANYFDMDPAFWRVLFFFLFFFGASGLLIYIVLWIVMPAKKDYGNPTVSEASEVSNLSGTPEATPDVKKKNSNMVAGIILILIGTVCLVARYVPRISWHIIWPTLLIILGLVLIIPFNSNKTEKSESNEK